MNHNQPTNQPTGKGKRSGVYGAYLLAVYDDATETYQTISKLGTGFSEEALVTLADALRPHVLDKPRPYYQVCWILDYLRGLNLGFEVGFEGLVGF